MNSRRGHARKDVSVHEMESAAAIWRFLVESGNVQPEFYDQDVVLQLCDRLKIRGDASAFLAGKADLGQALEDQLVSREDFIHALFSAAQPFAEMMAQLCSFFERHAIRGTDQALRMKFEFDDRKELTFDLKHFREWLSEWDKVEGMVESDCWDSAALWKLVGAISPQINSQIKIEDESAARWINANSYPGRQTALNHWASPPRPPETGISAVDQAVNRVFAAVSAVTRACAAYPTYTQLEAESRGTTRLPGARMPGEPGSPAPIVEWSIRSLHILESDYCSAALMRALWNWVEQLRRVPSGSRFNASQPVLSRLENLLSAVPTKLAPGEVDLERLLSFLRLPVWKERPSLYAAWMLPVIEESLAEYPVQIHDEGGTLRFSFKATRMATFQSSAGAVTLVAEHRAPLADPQGESRKQNAQPDYVLFLGDTHNPENAKVVLELKQYLRPSKKKFSNVLIDYTNAFTRAKVLLSDYGPMSPAVMSVVPVDLAQRAAALGDVRPGNTREVRDLQQRIRQALPQPPPGRPDQAPRAVTTIVVDISGSMREVLAWQAVQKNLHDLAEENPGAKWIAADTQVRASFTGADALDKILSLDMSGSTDLAQIVVQYQGNDAVVITDDDGESQLRALGINLKRIGLARPKGIEWRNSSG
jgi:hypothetical protein